MISNSAIPSELLRFEAGDSISATLVFEVLAVTAATTPDAAEGIESAFTAFAREYGASFSYFQLNDSARSRPVVPSSLAMVPMWMQDPASLSQPLLGVQMHSGPGADELQAPDFAFFQDQGANDPCGYIRLSVPFDTISSIDDAVLLLSMLERYPVSWAVAGFSVLWDPGGSKSRHVKRWLRAQLNRYRGLGCGEPLAHMVRQHLGLMRVGWCTVVGDAHLETLGGWEALRAQAEAIDGVHVRQVGSWAAVFAGEVPAIGDANRGELLPLQREVGRILEPIRAPRNAMEQVFLKPLRLDTADYLERFFVDP